MTDIPLDMKVREFATAIMERVADDPVACLGILNAASQIIAAYAADEVDPFRIVADLTTDIHSEALTMLELALTSKIVAADSNNVIPMEKLQ